MADHDKPPPLHSVARPSKDPPYPASSRCTGWHFSIDVARVRQSRTWRLAGPGVKPWLLMLWMTAWAEEIPTGSLPDDDELIAATIGMPLDQFQGWRTQLMRGWWRATDGRLYHDYITTLVLERLEWKRNETLRKQKWREESRGKTTGYENVPRDTTSLTCQRRAATSCDDTGSGSGSIPIGGVELHGRPPPVDKKGRKPGIEIPAGQKQSLTPEENRQRVRELAAKLGIKKSAPKTVKRQKKK